MTGQSLIPPLPLFRNQADKALRIFKRLRIPDIIGQPTMEEACGAWVFDLVAAIFGSLDPVTQQRAINEFFLLIPKGNAKTGYGAAIMVTAILMNERPNAEFHLISTTMNIANYAFKQAADMIKLDPELAKLFQIVQHQRTIKHRMTGAMLQVKAADTDNITGGKQVVTMIDETHEFAKKGNAAHVFVEIRGALGKRPDGFLIQTTTQSKEPPSGVFKQELDLARAVRDGTVQLPMLPILYEFPDAVIQAQEWRSPANWPLINPNFGRSVHGDDLANKLVKADREGAASIALIASQHFNVEIGIGLRTDRWVGADYWLWAGDSALTLDAILERSEVVTIGIDAGGSDDLLGLAVLGREIDTRRWLLWTHAWCLPKVFELRKDIAAKLLDLRNDGDLTVVDTSDVMHSEVVDVIEKVDALGLLPQKNAIGVDVVGVSLIVDEMERREFDTTADTGFIVGIPQNWTLNNSIKTLELRLHDHTILHCAQPLMTWCVANAKIEPRGNAITITKQVSGRAKIDPLMAALNAVAIMVRNPSSGTSVYDSEAEAEEKPAQDSQSDEIDPQILANPAHPQWQRMRELAEARMLKDDDIWGM